MPGHPGPEASVIVRARDKADTIVRALDSLRAQTVPVEIVFVDSGSVDGTLEIARERADVIVEVAPERFTFGGALNEGAQAASADVHFALSAHCAAPPHWVASSLTHYERDTVAGVNGNTESPYGDPLDGPWSQTLEEARAFPLYGFSNHAASWRASVWRQFPFEERMPSSEDKEWASRVLEAGWEIVFDRGAYVDQSHRLREGLRGTYTRAVREQHGLASFGAVTPMTPKEMAARFAVGVTRERRSPPHYAMQLAGSWVGRRAGARARIR